VRVSLFVTCLVDQLWPSVGRASVEVLRRAGCEVVFEPRQTCCAQPACNAGWRAEARVVARALLEAYAGGGFDALVVPSGSCAAQIRHLPELFDAGTAEHARAGELGARTHELGAFLVDVLGVDDLGARFDGRLTWHDACHGLRELGIRDQPRRLIARVRGAELVEAASAEACCGFGGTFSVKHPEISVAMLDQKLQAVEQLGIDALVSGDVSCLMQIAGRLQRRRSPIRTLHLAELLASGAERA
jgi:L-lactate dehydrogenase complex protein LldE